MYFQDQSYAEYGLELFWKLKEQQQQYQDFEYLHVES